MIFPADFVTLLSEWVTYHNAVSAYAACDYSTHSGIFWTQHKHGEYLPANVVFVVGEERRRMQGEDEGARSEIIYVHFLFGNVRGDASFTWSRLVIDS